MIRSCTIVTYYRLIIYSNTNDVLFAQKAVARETMMLAFKVKSHLVDKLKDLAAVGKTKSYAQMGRAGSGPEFHVNSESGLVGSLHLWVGLVGSRKLDPRPTLRWTDWSWTRTRPSWFGLVLGSRSPSSLSLNSSYSKWRHQSYTRYTVTWDVGVLLDNQLLMNL